MATRTIKRVADSVEIYVQQPGDLRCPVVGSGDQVLMKRGRKPLDGLFCHPYKAYKMLRDGEAVVLEED